MNIDNLVQMANGIGQFFDSMPDRRDAIDGVANHLRRYWEPRMRQQLIEAAERGEAAALHPLVAAALQAQRQALWPARRSA